MDQTESNNSRGITTLAHGIVSRRDGECETGGRGERKSEEARRFGGKFRKVDRPEERGSGWQLSSSWHNGDDDISSAPDPNVQDAVDCICISRHNGWPGRQCLVFAGRRENEREAERERGEKRVRSAALSDT